MGIVSYWVYNLRTSINLNLTPKFKILKGDQRFLPGGFSSRVSKARLAPCPWSRVKYLPKLSSNFPDK